MNARRTFLGGAAAIAATSIMSRGAWGQAIDTSRTRVVASLDVPLPLIGSVKPRSTKEISGSNWLLGCETLDRDFADWDQYKDYIAPLGIKRLRMQGGWAKTEKVRGSYDFAWLDHIIDDATSRGFQPWLQTSYGNKIYPGGGGDNLGAGLPTSVEALAAFDKWVVALVTRYRDKVIDWEVWNEPNFGDNTMNSAEFTADFNVRVATIIKRIQPQARISGLALGHYKRDFVDRFFARVDAKRGWPLFDTMTYHDYVYNPDSNVDAVLAIRASLEKYDKRLRLRQGENGAPSAGGAGRGALWDYPWSELTQAKWDLRRMLGNLGLDVESSIFGLAEMAYTSGPINRLNYKGILKSDEAKRIIRPKTAYYAIQNMTAIFDDRLDRIRGLEPLHNLKSAAAGTNAWSASSDRRLAMFGYRHKASGKHAYTVWQTENIPVEPSVVSLLTVTIAGADIDTPVWVDLITGAVHEIPASQWSRTGNVAVFQGVPVYDSPVVLADRSMIGITV